MSLRDLPFEITHEVEDGVVIADDTEWDGSTEYTDIMENDWVEKANRSDVQGAVTMFGDKIDLGRETQNRFAEEWGPKAEEVGIDRFAFVSQRIEPRVIDNVDTGETTIRIFNDIDEAIQWARAD